MLVRKDKLVTGVGLPHVENNEVQRLIRCGHPSHSLRSEGVMMMHTHPNYNMGFPSISTVATEMRSNHVRPCQGPES